MGLIEKLENFVNQMLILIGEIVARFVAKITPTKIKVVLSKMTKGFSKATTFAKHSPQLLIQSAPLLINKVTGTLNTIKLKLTETYKAAMAQYAATSSQSRFAELKKTALTPFLMVGQWVKGLSAVQTVMLLGFTAASVLSAINIGFSGSRIHKQLTDNGRVPASVEEEISYDRPDYYKKQTRHLDMTSIRLPVYFANVNELKSIDIDFTATMSNRMARMKLEKLEFQLRDHLILHIEPMVASFPLEEEGKEIMRVKLIRELNDFLINHKIEGEVVELKITYVLAN